MRPLYSIPFGADFIDGLSAFILKDEIPLDRLAVVFPGKRPALYLRRRLSEKLGRPFYAPGFFSVDTFTDHMAGAFYPTFTDLEYNDAIWLLYQAVESLEPFRNHPLRQKGFDRFYYWGQYLFSFIDQIDAENISSAKLHSLEKNAELGYDVPESINDLLVNISLLRERFHSILDEEHLFTRGYKCILTAAALDKSGFDEFEHIYFAGIFGMTGVEKKVTKHFWERGTGDIIFEGDVEEWRILKDLVAHFGAKVEKIPVETRSPERVRLYSGFDTHAEALKVLTILERTESEKTAVVLPLSEALFPLLTFAIDGIDTRYNISLGYPLMRTPVFDLISNVINSQTTKRDRTLYPVKSYLKVMLHPFVKNLNLHEGLRTLLLALERALAGEIPGLTVAHKAFVTLGEMENAAQALSVRDGAALVVAQGAVTALREVHDLFFRSFESETTLYGFAGKLEQLLDFVLRNTPVRSYVLSGEIFTRTFELLERVRETRFSREIFDRNEKGNRQTVCGFLLQFMKSATLPFETRPVEPLEIIGVLESRSIRFDTVIMLDANEGIMPQPRKIDPLVPLGVYEKLGIPSPEHNEEIYRYYFYRLVKSAKHVHLLYVDAEDRPRSRYIEQIIWEAEKEKKALDVIEVDATSFPIRLAPQGRLPEIRKSDEIYEALLARTYSPSDMDAYIRCPVSFYFSRVLKFEERKEVTEDIDAMDRGKIIHQVLFETFEPFKDKEIDRSAHGALAALMSEALEREFRHKVITGEFYLFKKIAAFKLDSFLRKNVGETENPFIVKYLEQAFESPFQAGDVSVRLKGRVDRIDFCPEKDEFTIIDYKTGGAGQYSRGTFLKTDFRSMADIHGQGVTFQLPVYITLFRGNHPSSSQKVNAKLIFLKNNREEMLFKTAAPEERESVEEKYMEGVSTVLGHILDRSVPFKPFDDLACSACPFNLLCHV